MYTSSNTTILKYKIVAFNDVYILFHFNILFFQPFSCIRNSFNNVSRLNFNVCCKIQFVFSFTFLLSTLGLDQVLSNVIFASTICLSAAVVVVV
jgi:hypothetical protein